MRQLDFTGRCVVITGAGRGIGRAYALEFARRGAGVVVVDLSVDAAQSVAAEIADAGGAAFALVVDLTEPSAGVHIIERALARFGAIDAVISNASINSQRKLFAELPIADLERMLAVNVLGAWRLLQSAWPHLAANRRGRILLTTSQAGLYGMPQLAEYATAKAALLGLMRTLALEGSSLGLKVNAIAPAAATRLTEETVSDPVALGLLRELQPPHLVAPVAVLLAHDACPVSGEIFVAGGGHAGRVFVGETQGLTLPAEAFTPEAVQARFNEVRDETGYRVPRDVSETGDIAQKAELVRRLRALGVIG